MLVDRNAAARSESEAKKDADSARTRLLLFRSPAPSSLTSSVKMCTEALSSVSAALSRMPKNASYYLTRAALFRMLGRNRLAVCDVNAALILDPSAHHLYAR